MNILLLIRKLYYIILGDFERDDTQSPAQNECCVSYGDVHWSQVLHWMVPTSKI